MIVTVLTVMLLTLLTVAVQHGILYPENFKFYCLAKTFLVCTQKHFGKSPQARKSGFIFKLRVKYIDTNKNCIIYAGGQIRIPQCLPPFSICRIQVVLHQNSRVLAKGLEDG